MKFDAILKKLKEIEWEYLVNRKENLLWRSISDLGEHVATEKALGIPWRTNFHVRLTDGTILRAKKERDALRTLFREGGISEFRKFRDRLILHVNKLHAVAKEIEETDCSALSNKELGKLLKQFMEAALSSHAFLSPMPLAGNILEAMIREQLPNVPEKEKDSWLSILSYPIKENEHVEEERAFYKLVAAYKQDKEAFERILNEYIERFGKIGARGYWWDRTWKREDILERVKAFLEQNKNPQQELKNLEKTRKEMAEETKRLYAKFHITIGSEFDTLIQLAKEYAYLRTWRTDMMYDAGYRVRNLFFEIVKRAGLKDMDAAYLTYKELMRITETDTMPIPMEELSKRKECFCTILINDDYFVVAGSTDCKKVEETINWKQETMSELQGTVAFPGKVQGRVKLVYTTMDLRKVCQGDILVAVMTFPSFIPAMEKAAAFVTDEGGILSHAAIVSREMRKPCITATKVATKVLRDGDAVEVDAEKGTVRKLSQ